MSLIYSLFKRYFNWIVLILIFVLFFLLRFYLLEKRFGFGWDQEYYGLQVYKIIKEHKLTLIGPRVVSDTGFFLGPYFIYLLVPFFIITKLHPMALLLFVYVANIVFFILAFSIIKKLFGFRVTILFLTFWAFSKDLIIFDTIAWNPLLVPTGVLLVYLLMFKIYQNKKRLINWFTLGIILGLFLNIHFQFIFVIIMSFIFLFHLLFQNKKALSKYQTHILSLLFGFALMFLPTLMFDLRHNFLNSKQFFSFIQNSGVNSVVPDYFAWVPVLTNFLKPFVFISNNWLMIFYFICLLILNYFLYKQSKKASFEKSFWLSQLPIWVITMVVFIKYGRRPSEYYFLFLLPIIYLMLSKLISQKRQFILYLLVYIFINLSINYPIYNQSVWSYKTSLQQKIAVARRIQKLDKNLYISFSGYPGVNNGFEYLFKWLEIENDENSKKHLEVNFPEKATKKKENQYYLIKHW
jgi:hypothetical protein